MTGFLRRHFLSIDPRTLGLWRVAIALLLLLDLGKRIGIISVFYVNDGLIPNHRVLWRPLRDHMLSFLFTFTETGQVQVAFVGIALVYLALLVGYQTRLMQALSWLSLVSLQVRVDLLSNGGDFVFCDLVLWSAFLPLGRRFSLDAALARQRRDAGGGELPPADDRAVVSLAVLAATLQLCVIYFFNAVHKTGPTWRDGSAVYWLLHQERIVTTLGLWMREHLPFWTFRGMSYTTLVVEGALPLLILSPWGQPWSRRLAIVAIFGLHTNIAMVSNLGVFSPVMITYSLMLLDARDWDAWERFVQARPRLRERRDALVAAGWRACGQFVQPQPWAAGAQEAPAQRQLRIARSALSETGVVLLSMVAISQVLVENPAIPRALHPRQPHIIRAAVDYFRLNQGWTMFAPDAPTSDMWIVVDAVTSEGRHVDPYNVLASRLADPSLRTIPARLAQPAAYCDYTVRIPEHDLFHEPLRDWIFNYPARTHRAADRIVHFDAYVVEQDSPQPGASEPSHVKARRFLRY